MDETISIINSETESSENTLIRETYNNAFIVIYVTSTKKFWLLYKQENYDIVLKVFSSYWKESVKSDGKTSLTINEIVTNIISYNELFAVKNKEILLGKPEPKINSLSIKPKEELKEELKVKVKVEQKEEPKVKTESKSSTIYSPKLFTGIKRHQQLKPMENKKCVVFDFDCTITTKHWYWFTTDLSTFVQKFGDISDQFNCREKILECLKTKITYTLSFGERNWIMMSFLGGYDRMAYLKDMFKTLTTNGCTLYILSRGNKSHIDTFLNITGLNLYFSSENVYGHEMRKDLFLKKLINKYEKVTYIDDDDTEHLAFLRSTCVEENKYTYIKLPHEGSGIDEEICRQLTN
jgi:predicted HAD superfamily phosphohydrolase YqeG